MSVVRNRHNSKKPFVILDKHTLWNEVLSLKALGLWARCISRPDDWRFNVVELIARCKEGRDSVYKGIKELIEANLCVRVQHKIQNRQGGWQPGPIEYVFLEVPASEAEAEEIRAEIKEEFNKSLSHTGFQDPENPFPENKDPENPHLPTKDSYQEKKEQLPEAREEAPAAVAVSPSKEEKKEPQSPSDGAKSTTIPITLKQFKALQKSFGMKEVMKAVELFEKDDSPKDNPFGWLKKCLEEKWYDAPDSSELALKRIKEVQGYIETLEKKEPLKTALKRVEAVVGTRYIEFLRRPVEKGYILFEDPKAIEKIKANVSVLEKFYAQEDQRLHQVGI